MPESEIDFAEVKGKQHVKRAIEVAVAGSYNIVRFFRGLRREKVAPFGSSRSQASRERKRLGALEKICLAPRHA